MQIKIEDLLNLKLYHWTPELVKLLVSKYGGDGNDFAEAIDDAKDRQFSRGSTHRSHIYQLANGLRKNPQKNTMEAFAEVMDIGIVLLPKRFRDNEEKEVAEDGNGDS